MYFIFSSRLSIALGNPPDVTGANERGNTLSTPPSYVQTLQIPEVNPSVRLQIRGKEQCRFRTLLFNSGRHATTRPNDPINILRWIGNRGREYAFNKPRFALTI